MELTKFKELIETFVDENFNTDSCRECHEIGYSIVPDNHKGSYDKAIKELFEEVRK